MQRQLNAWAVRVLLLAAVPVMAGAINGCASSSPDAEGAYSAPPGFTPQHTSKAVLSGFTFNRDAANHIVTATVMARRAARAQAGLAEAAKTTSAVEGVRLEAEFDDDYSHGMKVAISQQPNAYLRVVPVGAQSAKGRVRGDGALVAYEGAFKNVTSAFGGHERKVEEFLSIPSEADAPQLQYKLEPGPDFDRIDEAEGTLWAYAKDGSGLFTIPPPFADDAAGKHVAGTWKLDKSDSGYVLTANIDLKGLAYPVLLDPSFETPAWWTSQSGSVPNARAAAAGAYALDQNCVVLFGGALSDFTLEGDTATRCSSTQKWVSPVTTAGSPPSARAYHAMAWGGDGTYMFGGYSDLGVNNDFYRFNLNAGGTSGTWTQIPVSGSWPPPRYLHGAAWTGSSLIIWGGVASDGSGYRDVWSWNGSSWTQVCDACFGGTHGIYGFAYTTVVNGGTRSVYSMGGYDNPLGGGQFINNVYQWTGGGWSDVSGQPEVIPIGTTGNVDNTQVPPYEPGGRYMHWLSATQDNNLLMGSGTVYTNNTDQYPTDSWLWIDRTAEGFSPQWLRQPPARAAVLTNAPGARESATAVFDETLRQVVLFGGLNNSTPQSAIAAGRVYKGVNRSFTMTQSCTDDGTGNCLNSQATLVVSFPGLTGTACTSMQAVFVRQDAITGQWVTGGSVGSGIVAAVAGAGTCTITKTITWDPNNDLDLGVRVRDGRYVNNGTTCTTNALNTEIASGGLPACIGTTSSFVGSASCGEVVSPGFGATTVACTNY